MENIDLNNIPIEAMYKLLHRDYRALQRKYQVLQERYNALLKGNVDIDDEEFQKAARKYAKQFRKEEIDILRAKVRSLEQELAYYKAHQ